MNLAQWRQRSRYMKEAVKAAEQKVAGEAKKVRAHVASSALPYTPWQIMGTCLCCVTVMFRSRGCAWPKSMHRHERMPALEAYCITYRTAHLLWPGSDCWFAAVVACGTTQGTGAPVPGGE